MILGTPLGEGDKFWQATEQRPSQTMTSFFQTSETWRNGHTHILSAAIALLACVDSSFTQ